MKAKNTGMIIVGGGLIKHHICNANLMVRIVFVVVGRVHTRNSGYPNLICEKEHKMSTSSFLDHFFSPEFCGKKDVIFLFHQFLRYSN